VCEKSLGNCPVSHATRQDAECFCQHYGGRVLPFFFLELTFVLSASCALGFDMSFLRISFVVKILAATSRSSEFRQHTHPSWPSLVSQTCRENFFQFDRNTQKNFFFSRHRPNVWRTTPTHPHTHKKPLKRSGFVKNEHYVGAYSTCVDSFRRILRSSIAGRCRRGDCYGACATKRAWPVGLYRPW
jgi:hypothetical protein